MKTLLFYDTETTGLPENYSAPSSDLENWPRMVELGYALFSLSDIGEMTLLMENSLLIKPEGRWTIPAKTTELHGITTEQCKKEGIPLQMALEIFSIVQSYADFLVAHNVSFDGKIIRSSACYNGGFDWLSKMPSICTMSGFRKWVGLPKSKPPKLTELHYRCFGEGFDGAHRAGADCLATARCFGFMVEDGIINDATFQKSIDKNLSLQEKVEAKKNREAQI